MTRYQNSSSAFDHVAYTKEHLLKGKGIKEYENEIQLFKIKINFSLLTFNINRQEYICYRRLIVKLAKSSVHACKNDAQLT